MAFRKIINDSEGGPKFVTEQEEELVFDQTPTQGSFNQVTSDGVAKALSDSEKALRELMLNTIGGRTLVYPSQLSDDIYNNLNTKKITLTDVNGAIARFSTGISGAVGCVQLMGMIEADHDFNLPILVSLTSDASADNIEKEISLKKGINEFICSDYDFGETSASNVSVFFKLQNANNNKFVLDRFCFRINGALIPITDVNRFVVGSFTKVVTNSIFYGVAKKDYVPAIPINPYTIDNKLFQSQLLYKITLSNTTDAIIRYSTGYSKDSVGVVKVHGFVKSSVSRNINVIISPNDAGTSSITKSIYVEPNISKWVELEYNLGDVAVTNLSIFFQLRNSSEDTFVFDRFYIETDEQVFPVSNVEKFIYGSFTKVVENNSFPGCVSRAEIANYNKLFGKKILVFGDSISDTYSVNRYPTYVASLSGATQINYAVSSAGYAKNALYPHSKWGQEDTKVYNMIERAHNAGETCDLVIMAAGTNDWDFSAPYGQLSDVEQETMTTPTFYWCVAKAIKNLFEYYPLASYLVIIPLPRNQPNGSGTQHTVKSGTGKTLVDYCQAIKDVCYWYSIPYLDMMNDSNLHLESATAKAQWMPDGLHPSDNYAYQKFAPMVISRFNEIL